MNDMKARHDGREYTIPYNRFMLRSLVHEVYWAQGRTPMEEHVARDGAGEGRV